MASPILVTDSVRIWLIFTQDCLGNPVSESLYVNG